MNLMTVSRADAKVLYKLLAERTKKQSISHRQMPTFDEHYKFVCNSCKCGHPYRYWYLIEDKRRVVGSIYVTKRNEIGVFIFKRFAHQGFGSWAVREVLRMHDPLPGKTSDIPACFVANVNPKNAPSIFMFQNMGKIIQVTYALRR